MDRFDLVPHKVEERNTNNSCMVPTVDADDPDTNQGAKGAKVWDGYCQVDNCTVEVSGMKDYHARYKVCPGHLKADTVLMKCRTHRFCQQCGRFQTIEEFDGNKRSCRERLDKHNARRRRIREMKAMLKKTGTIDKAALMAKYGISDEELTPQAQRLVGSTGRRRRGGGAVRRPTSSRGNSSATSAGSDFSIDSFSDGGDDNVHGEQQVSHARLAATLAAAGYQPLDTAPGMFNLPSDFMSSVATADTSGAAAVDNAPSTSTAGVSNYNNTNNGSAMAQYNNGNGNEDQLQGMGSVPLLDNSMFLQFCNATNATTTNNSNVINNGNVHITTNKAAAAADAVAAVDLLPHDAFTVMDLDDVMILDEISRELGIMPFSTNDTGFASTNNINSRPAMGPSSKKEGSPSPPSVLLAAQPQQQQQQHSTDGGMISAFETTANQPRIITTGHNSLGSGNNSNNNSQKNISGLAGGDSIPFMPSAQLNMPSRAFSLGNLLNATLGKETNRNGSTSSSDTNPSSSLDQAMYAVKYEPKDIHYASTDQLCRMSAKLFNCTPDQLPADLRHSITNVLNCDSVEGYMRPGCVHITLDGLMNEVAVENLRNNGVRACVESLIAACPAAFAQKDRPVLVQLGDRLVMVEDGEVVQEISTAYATRMLPQITDVTPRVALSTSITTTCSSTLVVDLHGFNMDGPDDVILARSQGRYINLEVLSVTNDTDNRQVARVAITDKTSVTPGTIQFELGRVGFIAKARSLLMTSSPQVHKEVTEMMMTTTTPSSSIDSMGGNQTHVDDNTVLYELGKLEEFNWAVEQYKKEAGPCPSDIYPQAELETITRCAQRILVFGIQKRYCGMTALALVGLNAASATRNNNCKVIAAATENIAMGSTGFSILALAVRSQEASLVAMVLQYGYEEEEESWLFSPLAQGPGGLTAMHLAAVIGGTLDMCSVLTDVAKTTKQLAGWRNVKTFDGKTALDMARDVGVGTELESLLAHKSYAIVTANIPEPIKPVKTTGSTSLSRAGSTATTHPLSSPDRASSSQGVMSDDLLFGTTYAEENNNSNIIMPMKKKGGARRHLPPPPSNALLAFKDAKLEGKYLQSHNTGHTQVDIAFYTIAILSQLSWVFRWRLQSGLAGGVMITLVTFNMLSLLTSIFMPSFYVKNREKLCVLSHVMHKLGQVASTISPGVGTIYSSSYKPTVAILESSSFAQIAMLTFGAKMRFAVHLPVNIFHLLVALVIDGFICSAAFPNFNEFGCRVLMSSFQTVGCLVVPSVLVYLTEKRSRLSFLRSVE